MSSERLTDAELDYLHGMGDEDQEFDTDDLLRMLPDVQRAVEELRAHRQAALTAEEREALGLVRQLVQETLDQRPKFGSPLGSFERRANKRHDEIAEAIAILDRLLGAKP